MKKIVSAALVGAMVAGAFAADAKITLNHRTKLDVFDYLSVDNDGTKTITKEWMDLAGYDGKDAVAAKATADMPADSFKFVLNGEKCGTTLNINATNGKGSSAMVLNEFSAWAGWELGPGELKISTGTWKDGYADGSYRVKKDVDAWGAEGMDFERNKLGSQLLGLDGKSTFSVFIDNMASCGKGLNETYKSYVDNAGLSGFAEYAFDATDEINLKLLLGAVYVGDGKFDMNGEADSSETTVNYYDAAFVSRLQFNMKGTFASELIFKKASPQVNVFGLYFKPQMVDGLDATIGGSVEMASKGSHYYNSSTDGKTVNATAVSVSDDYKIMAFDLRARYAVNDQLSLTTFNNLSMIDNDAGAKLANGGLVGRKGGSGWAGSLAVKTVLWDCIEARYKINDTFTVMGSVGLLTPLAINKTSDDAGDEYSPEWRVTPAVQIYAASNASIYAGVAISGTSTTISDKDASYFAVQIPVVFRVKM